MPIVFARAGVAAWAVWMSGIPATAQQAAAPPATTGWVVAMDLGKCTLGRRTEGAVAQMIRVVTEPGTDRYLLTLWDTAMPLTVMPAPETVMRVDGKIIGKFFGDFAPAGDGFRQRYIVPGLAPDHIAAIALGAKLEVAAGGNRIRDVNLAGAKKAFAVLRDCETGQLIEWGADPAQFAAGGRTPIVGDRMRLVPQDVLKKVRFPGTPINPLHYAVVSETGVVEKCAAVHGIPNSDMEAVVCAYLTGRKIGEPARDASGKPVRGVIALTPALIRRSYFSISG